MKKLTTDEVKYFILKLASSNNINIIFEDCDISAERNNEGKLSLYIKGNKK